MSIDDIMFDNKENVMANEKKVEKPKKAEKKSTKKQGKMGIGLDVGTGYLCGAGFDDNNKMVFSPLRDAFFTIDAEDFNKSMFDKNSMKYVEKGSQVHIVGEDALTLAKIKNTSARRPLASGVVNPKERDAAPILKEMFKYCVGKYKHKDGEKCVFSVPGRKVGDAGFNVDYHSMSIESLLQSFNLDPVALNEAYAVILSEMENSKEVTGLGFSFGAGLVNVCFSYKSMKLFEFSIDKSGDFIDQKAAESVGKSESIINNIKEKNLNLEDDPSDMSPEERALLFAYRFTVRNVWKEVVRAFTETENVNIIDPVPVIVSGGTSLPSGFLGLFEEEMKKVDLPFEVTEIIPSKNRLAAVARGCLLWANHLEEK